MLKLQFGEISHLPQKMLIIAVFVLILGFVYVMLDAWHRNRVLADAIGKLSVCILLEEYLRSLEAIYLGRGWTPLIHLIEEMPMWKHFLIIFVFYTIIVVAFFYSSYWKKRNLSEMSIEESINTLPTGVGLFTEKGQICLANTRMNRLCQHATGKILSDGKIFWENITHGKILPECTVVEEGNVPIIRLGDGSIWRFVLYPMLIEHEHYYEVLATDITEVYERSLLLQKENAEREVLNERLRNYGETISAVTREKEILAANTKIHDHMNWLLLSTRHCIEEEVSQEERNALFRMWEENVLVMHATDEEEFLDPIKDFQEAAASIGIKFTVKGTMPKESEKIHVITIAVTESLTNAVRHADARELVLEMEEDHIVISNDGRVSDEPIVEGGGIGVIRRVTEGMGGRLEIKRTDRFALIIWFSNNQRGIK